MHTLFKALSIREIVISEAPAFFLAFVIAELFYKFHSFTLECLAFLMTWYLIGLTMHSFTNLFRKH